MSEAEFQLIKSGSFVAALALAAGIQHLRPHAASGGSWPVNGVLWGVNALLLGLVCAGCACSVSRWAEGAGLGLLNQSQPPWWIGVSVAVFGLDLVSYGWHRANHRIPLLWRFHQVHHSDPCFTVTTAVRFHPGELLLALPLRLTAVALLGISIPGVIVFEAIFAFANFIEHGDIDLPRWLEARLERLFVTPALHRRHHSRERSRLNSNYGTIFSFWDRVFGSFGANQSSVRVRVGLPGTGATGVWETIAMPARAYYEGE